MMHLHRWKGSSVCVSEWLASWLHHFKLSTHTYTHTHKYSHAHDINCLSFFSRENGKRVDKKANQRKQEKPSWSSWSTQGKESWSMDTLTQLIYECIKETEKNAFFPEGRHHTNCGLHEPTKIVHYNIFQWNIATMHISYVYNKIRTCTPKNRYPAFSLHVLRFTTGKNNITVHTKSVHRACIMGMDTVSSTIISSFTTSGIVSFFLLFLGLKSTNNKKWGKRMFHF